MFEKAFQQIAPHILLKIFLKYALEDRKIKKRISIYVASEQGLNATKHLNRRD